jgi:hypothetical protein
MRRMLEDLAGESNSSISNLHIYDDKFEKSDGEEPDKIQEIKIGRLCPSSYMFAEHFGAQEQIEENSL